MSLARRACHIAFLLSSTLVQQCIVNTIPGRRFYRGGSPVFHNWLWATRASDYVPRLTSLDACDDRSAPLFLWVSSNWEIETSLSQKLFRIKTKLLPDENPTASRYTTRIARKKWTNFDDLGLRSECPGFQKPFHTYEKRYLNRSTRPFKNTSVGDLLAQRRLPYHFELVSSKIITTVLRRLIAAKQQGRSWREWIRATPKKGPKTNI